MDDRRMSLANENVPEKTSYFRGNVVVLRGDFLECRPSRGERRTTKTTNAYDSIVCALADRGEKTGIKQRRLEDLLMAELGASQPATLRRHQEVMVRLGYLKQVTSGTAYLNAEFDLVGSKLALVRKAHFFKEKWSIKRRGRPRL